MSVPATAPYLQVNTLEVSASLTAPASCITDTNFTGTGSTALQAAKVQQQRTYLYAQDRNNWNVVDWKAMHFIYGAIGAVVALWAKLPVVCAAGHTVTVTWRKNGTSIGTVTFTDADAANTVRTASPSPTALVTTDDLSVQITVSGANPGKGIMAMAMVTEYPAP